MPKLDIVKEFMEISETLSKFAKFVDQYKIESLDGCVHLELDKNGDDVGLRWFVRSKVTQAMAMHTLSVDDSLRIARRIIDLFGDDE